MSILRRLFRSAAPARPIERRRDRRLRTRLRPGKLLDEAQAFLADCAIVERSRHGLRVRSFGETRTVGEAVVVFDEKDACLRAGRVVWRNGAEAGILAEGEPVAPGADELRRIAGPYYAIRE